MNIKLKALLLTLASFLWGVTKFILKATVTLFVVAILIYIAGSVYWVGQVIAWSIRLAGVLITVFATCWGIFFMLEGLVGEIKYRYEKKIKELKNKK